MHAILAYAATNSTGVNQSELRVNALHHRMIALKRIGASMTEIESNETPSRIRDAVFGAYYLLAMQCFRLQDGWIDFLPLLRGINLIIKAILRQGDNAAWNLDQEHVIQKKIRREWAEGRIERPPRRLTVGAMASCRILQRECHAHKAQMFIGVLVAAATALDQDDIWKGYESIQYIWEVLSDADSIDSKALEDCSDSSTRMLLAHWLAMVLLFKPFYDLEVVLGREGIVSQLPTWMLDISRVATRDGDGTEQALQWPLEVVSSYSAGETGHNGLESK